MSKLKILRLSYIPKNENYSNDGFVFQQLDKQTNVVFINMSNLKTPVLIDATIKEMMNKHNFDFIYKNFMGTEVDTTKMKPLHKWGPPVFISSGDCHSRLLNPMYNDRANHHKFTGIIVNNKASIPCFQDYFDRDMHYIWLPWSYDPNTHKDYGQKKIYDTTIPAGSLRIALRQKIHAYLKSNKYSYKWIKGLKPYKYAMRINQSKIAISTCQIENKLYYKDTFIGMTFNKYYEIPMCGTLHIGQRSADVESLGFIDDYNMVMFDTFDECIEKVEYYLLHKVERNRIIQNAITHVKNMTYENRIKDFLIQVKGII